MTFGAGTRGSLGSDAGFVEAVRTEYLAVGPPADLGVLTTTDPADVPVPFAGDVGDQRVVLVEVVDHQGAPASTQALLWYHGPRGASAHDLVASRPERFEDGGQTAWTWSPGTAGRGVLVVLSSAAGDAHLTTAAADGTRTTVPLPRAADGHWEAVVPWDDPVALTTWFDAAGVTGPLAPPDPGAAVARLVDEAGAWVHTPGPGLPGPDRVAEAVLAAQRLAGVPVAGSTRYLLWGGRLDRLHRWESVAVAVRVPDGSYVVTALTWNPDPADRTADTVVARLPAGPVEDLVWVWMPFHKDSIGGPYPVGVVGPARAVTAVVDPASGGRRVRLRDGAGALSIRETERGLDLRDAAGTVLATVGPQDVATSDQASWLPG